MPLPMLIHAVAGALALASPEPLVVRGDVVRLRAAPSPDAAVVARLRVNTALELVDAAAEGAPAQRFVRVRMRDRPDVVGYVARELIGAPLFEEHELLHRHAAHPGPVHLALCRAGRAVLLARDDGTRTDSLTGGGPLRVELQKLARELDAATWYRATARGPEALPGTPFVTPFLAPLFADRTGPLPPDPGDGVGGAAFDDGVKLVLGPCAQEGEVFTTARASLDAAVGVPVSHAASMQAALLGEWGFAGSAEGTTPTLVRVDGRPVPSREGAVLFMSIVAHGMWRTYDLPAEGERAVFAIADHDGRPLALIPERRGADGTVPAVRWLAWSGEGARFLRVGARSLVVLPTAGMDGVGAFIVAPRGADVEVTAVETDASGC